MGIKIGLPIKYWYLLGISRWQNLLYSDMCLLKGEGIHESRLKVQYNFVGERYDQLWTLVFVHSCYNLQPSIYKSSSYNDHCVVRGYELWQWSAWLASIWIAKSFTSWKSSSNLQKPFSYLNVEFVNCTVCVAPCRAIPKHDVFLDWT